MDFYFSPQVFSDLHNININSYGTLCHNSRACQETLSKDFETKERWHHLLRWKKAQVLCIGKRRVEFNSSPKCTPPPLTATCHFTGEEGNTPKPLCSGSYNKSMGFVNDMINSNSISCNTWKWPKKLFFQPTWPNYPEHLHKSQIIWGETHTYIVPITIFGGLIHVAQDVQPHPSTSRYGQPPSREVCHFHFQIPGLLRVALDVMYVLCSKRSLGDFTFVKTVM
jgi:hypothetical protein